MGVLSSGKGSNLRNLFSRGYRVSAVGTNRPGCGAAAFARQQGLRLGEFSQRRYPSSLARDEALSSWLLQVGVDIVVNAGYDRILSEPMTRAFAGRMLNIHPSLLPSFGGGMDAVERALQHGVKITGCTVHLVTEAVDAGPILVQVAVPVLPGDDTQRLLQRIQAEEHRILPQAIDLLWARLGGSPQIVQETTVV
ncbi:MAG: phosphoribosylglycinamide formyltransferase [Candidatus Dormibacteraeota bacterium]|uniref:Phosphoribosylglycinamide formyltransferase n=1 Tax=Candidatus Dormiibacter inghamiae TaxID=3127013 RepID=A0A934K978_9BACT|nr:phosphoribosylglycinamide formyltransferase [Candidatus Dormibacteraeota bacterium]MBJ7606639.1 phosphoribosylglycinamide formyltransferase [Candidatus Dormibacteraeota bacterium]